MAARIRVVVVAMLGMALVVLSLAVIPSRTRQTSSRSAEQAAVESAELTGRRAAFLTRPPARFRPPADGGDAPWQAEVHDVREGANAEPVRLVRPPRPESLSTEARLRASELAELAQTAPTGPVPVTATVLVLPVEYAGSATLDHQVHTPDLSECITVTEHFAGPMHGAIPYPGGSPATTIDNQTVYYPSTEPDDYARLIFGRTGYTEPLRAGDPNVNGGAGVDIAGLTVENYFRDQSDGNVVITGTVAPWVALDHPEAWYGLDQCVPNVTPRAIPDEQLGSLAGMTVAAAEKLKAMDPAYADYGFWKRLDTDGDGFVDSLLVMHAGRGQEYGGGSEGEASIWSRSASIAGYAAYAGGYVIHDGGTPDDPTDDIRLGDFTLMPEDSDIGVLVEEFGHSVFDVPDLYTNDSSNSVGWWAPMSAGIWGGELGGVRPVNMPLWFRMTADCHGQPCGWANPMAVVSYTTPSETIVLGQAGSPAGGKVEAPDSPFFGQTIHEGLRVDLPIQSETVANPAGPGGGAYTGADSGETRTIDRTIYLDRLPAGDGPILQLAAVWNIPRYWGYFFVEVDPDGDGVFESLPDLDGRFSDDNPFGLNDGWGLTGPGPSPGPSALRFDLSAWRHQRLPLRLRYITYRGGPGTGVWLDDVDLHITELGQDLRQPVDDFGAGLGAWTNEGWVATPYTLHHPQYYLVEWRNAQGWDRSLLGAYQTNYRDADEWRVDRVPANLPGAVVMLRNLKYPFSGALNPQLADPPSWGAKYGLLVVDPNFTPVERPSGGPFSGALQSLDAALTLPGARQPDYTLELRDPDTKALSGTETIAGLPGRSRFDDALGYAPGLRAAADGKLSPWDADGSVVLPARDGMRYTTRVVDSAGAPAEDRYGEPYAGGHVLGTGDPGDDNAQYGVRIEVVGQAADGSWGAVRVYNAAMDYSLTADPVRVTPAEPVMVTAVLSNRGAVASSVVTVSIEGRIDGQPFYTTTLADPIRVASGATLARTATIDLPSDMAAHAGAIVEIIARFDDGDHVWVRRLALAIADASRIFLPALQAFAQGAGAADAPSPP
ncbi:MAG: M6 family metalloprotease domain-containing protein [Ardenticatenales bacterium]